MIDVDLGPAAALGHAQRRRSGARLTQDRLGENAFHPNQKLVLVKRVAVVHQNDGSLATRPRGEHADDGVGAPDAKIAGPYAERVDDVERELGRVDDRAGVAEHATRAKRQNLALLLLPFKARRRIAPPLGIVVGGGRRHHLAAGPGEVERAPAAGLAGRWDVGRHQHSRAAGLPLGQGRRREHGRGDVAAVHHVEQLAGLLESSRGYRDPRSRRRAEHRQVFFEEAGGIRERTPRFECLLLAFENRFLVDFREVQDGVAAAGEGVGENKFERIEMDGAALGDARALVGTISQKRRPLRMDAAEPAGDERVGIHPEGLGGAGHGRVRRLHARPAALA